MINGQIEFYDEESEWGLIRGDDNHLFELRAGPAPGAAGRRQGPVRAARPPRAGPAPSPCGGSGPHPAPIDLRRGGART